MQKKIVLKSVLALLCCVALAGCQNGGAWQQEPTPTGGDKVGTTTTVNAETTTTTQAFYLSDEEHFTVPTPYVPLKYPIRWSERVGTDVVSESPYTLSFSTELSVGHVPLFDIVFGTCDQLPVGELTIDGETVSFYIIHHELSADAVPQEEYLEWNMMCEDVNVIISGLVYEHGMTLLK